MDRMLPRMRRWQTTASSVLRQPVPQSWWQGLCWREIPGKRLPDSSLPRHAFYSKFNYFTFDLSERENAKSCRHLQEIAANTGLNLGDGVYTLHPQGQSGPAVKAYCDMTRDGGGWTLLVSSHTNTWTAGNLRLRNEGSPSLTSDYSILKYADDIKNDANIVGNTFEYRLEAQNRGRWGGVWSADRSYSFTATNNKQTNVHLVKKFDDWTYSYKGIDKRMPWVSGARLTTSESATRNWWGTITGKYQSIGSRSLI
ncbi:predicted protein [Nematostella vectensis]|uniref:Fibrinogen C-terminal domain-containing protein n=1 Tax=Nematostella vectensis TaxID=45351 RepID=A7RL84_NEMVE|nr:predicted protein [Nematostella vectensis]|eukprot:XP_001639947.1 predicted protein [Nematostella vectensis]